VDLEQRRAAAAAAKQATLRHYEALCGKGKKGEKKEEGNLCSISPLVPLVPLLLFISKPAIADETNENNMNEEPHRRGAPFVQQ
jgi:hypothetical protein